MIAHRRRAGFEHASRKKTTAALALLVLCGCAGPSLEQLRALPPNAYPARFLLSFDDGPSTREPYNPTRAILDALAHSPVQPGIKAVFFLQTRDPHAGGSAEGRALMRREHAEGHVLGVHSGSPRGHSSHILPCWRMRPANSPASSPLPQKKSARTAPRIAPPVS